MLGLCRSMPCVCCRYSGSGSGSDSNSSSDCHSDRKVEKQPPDVLNQNPRPETAEPTPTATSGASPLAALTPAEGLLVPPAPPSGDGHSPAAKKENSAKDQRKDPQVLQGLRRALVTRQEPRVLPVQRACHWGLHPLLVLRNIHAPRHPTPAPGGQVLREAQAGSGLRGRGGGRAMKKRNGAPRWPTACAARPS